MEASRRGRDKGGVGDQVKAHVCWELGVGVGRGAGCGDTEGAGGGAAEGWERKRTIRMVKFLGRVMEMSSCGRDQVWRRVRFGVCVRHSCTSKKSESI